MKSLSRSCSTRKTTTTFIFTLIHFDIIISFHFFFSPFFRFLSLTPLFDCYYIFHFTLLIQSKCLCAVVAVDSPFNENNITDSHQSSTASIKRAKKELNKRTKISVSLLTSCLLSLHRFSCTWERKTFCVHRSSRCCCRFFPLNFFIKLIMPKLVFLASEREATKKTFLHLFT